MLVTEVLCGLNVVTTQFIGVYWDDNDDGVFAGIPPDQCQLPLEPAIPVEIPDAFRFGTTPESRFEYNSFPRSVNIQ